MAGTLVQHFNGQPLEIPRQLTPYTPIDAREECIGREADLQKLSATLLHSPKVVVVNGLGGIGKTTLAKAWFQQDLAGYDHFAWIELAGNDDRRDQRSFSFVETIAYHPTLAVNLHLSFGEKEPPFSRFQTIMNALRQLQGRNLLVVDNAGLELEQKDIKDEMPLPLHWQVLVTSRSQLRDYTQLRLDRLSPEFATELFRKYFQGDCPDGELAELLAEVDYHTLTVELLAKTLQSHLGVLRLPELTAKIRRRELADPALQRRIALQHSPEETEVYIHLLTSFDCAGLDAEERLLLARCSALPPGGGYSVAQLEEWLLPAALEDGETQAIDRRSLQETLGRLERKGWLNRSPEFVFSLHRMVQQAVLYQLQPGMVELEVLVNTFTKKLGYDFSTNYTLLFQWIPYGEQILTIMPEKERDHVKAGVLMNNLAVVLRNFGQYARARDLLEAALSSDLKNLGPDHPTIAVRRSNLANVYRNLEEHTRARDLLEAALAYDLKNFGPDHPNVAIDQSNLAIVYRYLGDYAHARDLLEAALASDLKNFGPDHPNVAVRQSNLANVYRNLGEYARARDLLETALASDLKNFGPEHPTIAIRQINLGVIFKDLDNKQKARELFQQAYNLSRKQLGEQHPQTQNAKKWLDSV